MFTVYLLRDPRDNSIRYVGRTKRLLRQRLDAHVCGAKRGMDCYSARWIRQLLALGLRPVIEPIEQTDDPNPREIFWIAHYRALGCSLTNETAGGEGLLSYVKPQAVIEKIRASNIGKKKPPHSPESKAKISAAHKGKVTSEETKEKLRKPKPAGFSDKMRARKGEKRPPFTEEHRNKLSAAQKGKKQTESHRLNAMEAQRKAREQGKYPALRGDDNPSRKHPERLARGERCGTARFTEAQIIDMRRRYQSKEANQSELAREYGTKQGVIWLIVNRKTWKHVI